MPTCGVLRDGSPDSSSRLERIGDQDSFEWSHRILRENDGTDVRDAADALPSSSSIFAVTDHDEIRSVARLPHDDPRRHTRIAG
jgi:hypothetical protein